MAYLGKEFDATTVEPSAAREVIPPGWYTALVETSDVKPTKKAVEAEKYGTAGANDRLLELTFKVIEGEHKGSTVWERLNIVNSNPVAQEIAEKDFSALCHAIGKLRVKDSSELHHQPMLIKVDVEQKEGYSARNVIKGFKPVGEKTVAGTVTSAPTTAKAAPAWSKK
jgi:hypothetical protein